MKEKSQFSSLVLIVWLDAKNTNIKNHFHISALCIFLSNCRYRSRWHKNLGQDEEATVILSQDTPDIDETWSEQKKIKNNIQMSHVVCV